MVRQTNTAGRRPTTPHWQVAALWALVTVPALWGFVETLTKAITLFTA